MRVGNLYMRSVKSYHEVIADNDEENTVNYTYRVNLLMGGFFLISLCLGVSGTFWMQTRNRREEVGAGLILSSTAEDLSAVFDQNICSSSMMATMGNPNSSFVLSVIS